MHQKTLNERVLELTGVFETSQKPPGCYSSVSGNFDKQGISFGVLQWNFGQKSLQPILKTLISAHRDIMERIFQKDLVNLEEILAATINEQIKWADQLSLRSSRLTMDKHALKEP